VHALATERDRTSLGRPNEDPADVRVLTERGNQPWVPVLDLLE
jgi:hypothetical protein